MMYFSENLKTIRNDKFDWTQQKMADQVGVKLRTYQSWEEGRARPSYEVLCRISIIFSVSIDNLLKWKASVIPSIEFEEIHDVNFFDKI